MITVPKLQQVLQLKMKGNKVQTLSALYACAPLIDGLGHATRSVTFLSQAGCVIVSGYISPEQRWTWIHIPLVTSRRRWAERAKPGRGKPVLIMHIGFFACFHAISLERSGLSKIATLLFHTFVALKLVVSLISRLVACSARIVVDTDAQTMYCNPRCACAPRVNYSAEDQG